jgi:hypothetical protein
MSRISKSIILISIGIVAIFFLGMTWFFPYSFFSIYKSYSYKPDSIVVKEYVKDLNNFKSTFEENSRNDLTDNRLHHSLQIFEQDWLINGNATKMGEQEIDSMLFEVKEVRQSLLSLVAQEEYSKEERNYLILSLENLLFLKESIRDFKYSKSASRRELHRQFSNINMRFISNFDAPTTFYEISKRIN